MTTEFASTGSAVLDEIAAVIGPKAALDFAVEFRGERVYIPQNPALRCHVAHDRARPDAGGAGAEGQAARR